MHKKEKNKGSVRQKRDGVREWMERQRLNDGEMLEGGDGELERYEPCV